MYARQCCTFVESPLYSGVSRSNLSSSKTFTYSPTQSEEDNMASRCLLTFPSFFEHLSIKNMPWNAMSHLSAHCYKQN